MPPPMTAILRPVIRTLLSSLSSFGPGVLRPWRPSALASLFGAGGDPDGRGGLSLPAEHMPQGRLELGVAEMMPGVDQPLRVDILAGLGDLASALGTEQQPRPERRY